MKVINVFILFSSFLQFIPSGAHNCSPCECSYNSYIDEDLYGVPNRYKYRTNRKFNIIICERKHYTDKVQSWWPDSFPVIFIKYQPITKYTNGVLKRSQFERLKNLRFFDCFDCSARSIEVDILFPFRNTLQELMIEGNNLQFIPVGMLQYTRVLEIANFRNNGIKIVYKGTCTDLMHLRWICYASNKITTVEIGALRNLPALEFVEFNDNWLTFVDPGAFDIKDVYTAKYTRFDDNPWFCNMELCPFMHRTKSNEIKCKEPIYLHKKTFAHAVIHIGTRTNQTRYIVDEFDKSVTMGCSSCSYQKLKWQKRGTEAIGAGGLPDGCVILQADGSQTSNLVIADLKYDHNGNYSCYNPDCITSDCPTPVIALIVQIAEPKWNFTDAQGKLDEVVRFGSTGVFYVLLPFLIYSIIMAVAMSAYYIYIQIQRKAAPQQP